MKKARIINNIAVDVTDKDVTQLFHPTIAAEFQDVPANVENGWRIEEGVWIEVIQVPYVAMTETGVIVPQTIEAWQARDILEVMGLTAQIEAILSALDPLVAARYKAFTVFDRYNALIVMLASQLGFTDAQTDSMFIVANQITSDSTRADIEALLRAEGLMP